MAINEGIHVHVHNILEGIRISFQMGSYSVVTKHRDLLFMQLDDPMHNGDVPAFDLENEDLTSLQWFFLVVCQEEKVTSIERRLHTTTATMKEEMFTYSTSTLPREAWRGQCTVSGTVTHVQEVVTAHVFQSSRLYSYLTDI